MTEKLENIEEVEKTEIETRAGKVEVKVNFRVMKNVEKKLGIKFMEAVGKINDTVQKSKEAKTETDIIKNFDLVFLYEFLFELQIQYDELESFTDILAINKTYEYIGAINQAVGKLMTL